MKWDNSSEKWILTEETRITEKIIWPIDGAGNEKVWTCSAERAKKEISDLKLITKPDGSLEIHKKYRPNQTGALPGTWWEKPEYSASESGTKLLKSLFNDKDFDFPKSINLVVDNLRVANLCDKGIVIDFFAGSGTTGHATINLNREDDGSRKYILVEMGDYFDSVLKPRLQKAVYSENWKNGKPVDRHTGISHCFKYLRLESYEDCLNNLEFKQEETRTKALAKSKELREEYMLHYMLETETRGSQSLLNIDSFVDPTAYQLKVKKPGTDEYEVRNVDLIETFNYLIGLRVQHMDAPQSFTAEFYREPDPELPDDKHTRLKMASRKQTPDGPWWFRKIEGWVPGDNGKNEKILIVWRKLTDDQEKDNLMLDEWFKTIRVNPRDFEYDTIYVNGSNNLPNLRQEGENWKVRLIEKDFMKRMWDVEDV
ncbi:conserved hypothetical protein [Desulfosarcina cetonica]|nr:conserved hypothetical protein [Desulfosarcina cetonica]